MDIIRVFGRLGLPRAPFWAQAAAVCAALAVVGVVVLGDYGVTADEPYHRQTTATVADYTLGVSEEPPRGHDRYYGVAFEMPLLLLECALGLQDTRHIYLTRHLLMHLFFIAGGFVCGMLAYRMFGNRWIASLAILMFLLHPRLYAHSFFNVKDVPFATLLLIALYLAHRAFRRDTLGAFLLCGAVVGLTINVRVFGLMLLPMVLAMRAPDLWQAGKEERKRILITGAAFLAAALAAVYISHPYYWENPLRFVEGIRVLSQHPTTIKNLFMGDIYRSDELPWNFIPVWFAITAPPVTLLLGAIGCAAVCWQGITRPLAALRDREIRFRILLLGCFVMPVMAVVALQSNIYNGWRHMYFLWTPFCLLAAVGLRTIANSNAGKGVWKVGARLPGWVGGGGRLRMARRAFAYGAAGVGLITTATAMAALHPHQQVYFNTLADTDTPGELAKRYDMDYWLLAHTQLMEYLLARYPDVALRAWPEKKSALILPQNDRERIAITGAHEADYRLYPTIFSQGRHVNLRDLILLEEPAFHSVEAYGSAIGVIIAPNSETYRDHYRAAYADTTANGTLLVRADFDIYIHNGGLRYLNADCEPPSANPDFRIFLRFFPVNRADLPPHRRERGFENRDFNHAAYIDGKCVNKQLLPSYPIARIETGQNVGGEVIWHVDIDIAAYEAAQTLYESIAAGDYGQPVAQSDFDVYLIDYGLAYIKENCAVGDADARFFLHIFPADPADLPADGREHGFANLDFQFAEHGAYAGDKCVVTRELPGYAIERIRTGQFVSGEGRVWSAEFAVGR